MKILQFLVATAFLSCTENTTNHQVVVKQEHTLKANDTSCNNDIHFIIPGIIKLIDACQIRFSDSISTRFEIDMGAKRLTAEYNYENNFQPLKFLRYHDTIEVKILQLVRSRSKVIVDTVFISQDTLFLREKAIGPKIELDEFVCEEFRYRFLVTDKFTQTIFRFYPEMKEYGD